MVCVLEEIESCLQILEEYLPNFFANSSQIYHKNMLTSFINTPSNHQTIFTNENIHKKPVEEKTKKHLLKSPVFQLEYEFYDFVMQRLHLQKAHLNLI